MCPPRTARIPAACPPPLTLRPPAVDLVGSGRGGPRATRNGCGWDVPAPAALVIARLQMLQKSQHTTLHHQTAENSQTHHTTHKVSTVMSTRMYRKIHIFSYDVISVNLSTFDANNVPCTMFGSWIAEVGLYVLLVCYPVTYSRIQTIDQLMLLVVRHYEKWFLLQPSLVKVSQVGCCRRRTSNADRP